MRRRKAGKGFTYIDSNGQTVRDKGFLNRARSLVIPPAWQQVWICPCDEGHLQATGIDARGRRQYRYHPHYRQVRNHTKFHRMLDFAKALPEIRRQVEMDLKRPGLSRPKVIATVVRLLETTFIRVGNEEYVRENLSFGLTTMRDRHVKIDRDTLRFQFRGKSGQMHDITLEDKRLARIVRACRDLPGYELFQYRDSYGEIHSVDSADVNGYLHEVSGEDFSAKDFRTWAGTIQTAVALTEIGPAANATEAKRNIVEAIRRTSKRLGNRPATCRNYYVHPAILDSYLDGSLVGALKGDPEQCVVNIIRKRSKALIEALPGRAA
ncbi:MAG: DNA topoisomerase IB [Acidobacteriota bacterium]|nr:DNA topoisomerase IB [Acidobacteriota bacterium]